jgi:hypothetical protein
LIPVESSVSYARRDTPGGIQYLQTISDDLEVTGYLSVGTDDTDDATVTGDLGVGTGAPGTEIHVVDGFEPALTLEQDTSQAQTAQISRIITSDRGLAFSDITAVTEPFLIEAGSPDGGFIVHDSGDISNGLEWPTDPDASFHIYRDDGTARFLVEEAAVSTAARTLFLLQNDGRIRFTMENTGTGKFWSFTAFDSSFAINHSSSPGSELRVLPATGDLEVKGEVYAVDFNATSDRNLKEGFTDLDSQEVLHKVADLEISEWTYKTGHGGRHVGPMGQDFHAAFGLGKDDRHINPMDAAGISMAAIQGLYEIVKQQDAELESLRTENAEMKARLEALERTVLGK